MLAGTIITGHMHALQHLLYYFLSKLLQTHSPVPVMPITIISALFVVQTSLIPAVSTLNSPNISTVQCRC